MQHIAVLLLASVLTGCAGIPANPGPDRSALQHDLECYAIASCLALQAEPYLQDQGDAWASVIIQRRQGGIEAFAQLADSVRQEASLVDMMVMRDEMQPDKMKSLPLA